MPQERLQKLLARAGIASRRASEDLIKQGRVSINGQKASLGAKADPAQDTIRVDGEVIKFETVNLVYIMLNKPNGIISAASAQRQEKRRTVLDLVQVDERVYPVGRLDADSEGLILLTNDGDLTQRLSHPSFGHQKTYRVLVLGTPTADQIEKWAKGGIQLEDGPTSPCTIAVDKTIEAGTWLEIQMGEGRKRQIRRTANKVGLRVIRLIRTHIGSLKLTGIKPGEWRYLTDEEIAALKREAARSMRRPRRSNAGARPGGARPARPKRPGTSGGPGSSGGPRSRPGKPRRPGGRGRPTSGGRRTPSTSKRKKG